jgi:hypothetical protein
MNRGYIKLWRKILEWEWWEDPNAFRVFIFLLLITNHSTKRWRGVEVKKGEVVTSTATIKQQTKLSTQQVRSALARLKSTNEITIKTTNRFSIIKLNNYDLYNEDNKQLNKQATNKQQTNNKQATTTKHYKNEKNDKKIISKEIEQAQTTKYGNEEINKILEALTGKIGIDDFADSKRWSRIYGKHCLQLLKKLGKMNLCGDLT